MAYDIEKLNKLLETLAVEEAAYLDESRAEVQNEQKLSTLKEQVLDLQQQVADHKKHIREHSSYYFTGVAFISFQSMEQSDRVVKAAYTSTFRWILRGFRYRIKYKASGKYIRVDPAPESEEIVWENLKYSAKQRFCRKLITLLVTLGILGIAFSILYAFKYLSYKLKKQFMSDPVPYTKADGTIALKYDELSSSEENLLQFISIGIYVVSKIINKIFDKLIGGLTSLEKNYSLGGYNVSAVIKTVIAQFLNTSCLIVIVHVTLRSNELRFIWGAGGLLSDIEYILIFNSIVLPLLNLLNFGLIAKLFKRCKLKKHASTKMFTQKQAHEIMEGVPMDPIRSYTDIYQILLTCCFFIPALPANSLIHCASLAAIYWIQKVYILRGYTRPRLLQCSIAFKTIMFVKIAVFVTSVGELYFDWILRGDWHLTIILQVIITFVLIWVPVEDMLLDLYIYSGDEATLKKDVTFQNTKSKFASDYARENPLTMEEATIEHINFLKVVSDLGNESRQVPEIAQEKPMRSQIPVIENTQL